MIKFQEKETYKKLQKEEMLEKWGWELKYFGLATTETTKKCSQAVIVPSYTNTVG